MVRTRAKKGTSARQKDSHEDEQCTETAWKLWLLDFENELEGRMHKMKIKLQEEMEGLDRHLMVTLAQIPSDEAELPPARSLHGDSVDSIESFDSTLTSTVKKPGEGFITSTAFKPMPPPPEPKTTRQSRTRTTRHRTSSLTDVSNVYPVLSSTRRVTRSSSQPRDIMSKVITDYQTPMNKPDRTLTAVTPKVDPYSAMPLKRYARQGEMAISLTGSPLMMTTSITEPNISLPLNNGQEVYSILPTSGPCPAIPSLDSQTRQKLLLLRENLSKILGE